MKAQVIVLIALISVAKGEDEAPPKPGVHRATREELALFTLKEHPEERLAVLFTGFKDGTATYKWMYFNPLTSDWVAGQSKLQEVYDKVQTGEGLQVTSVPGHDTTIQAGRISIQWSRGNKEGCWLYYRPEHLALETLPADQLYKLQ